MTTARLPHQVPYKNLLSILISSFTCCFNEKGTPFSSNFSLLSLSSFYFPIRISSPIRRCSLKGKATATASNSDNSSSPRLLGPRAITLGGMILRPTSDDLDELNENERNAVQFGLELEEREASGQVAVDDVMQETIPSLQPESDPYTSKDKASAEKAKSLALADLLTMRWTGTNFEFDEEIDPEQERRLSVKKNQRWENHFPTRSTFKSVRRLVLQTSPPAGFSFLNPVDHQRPWTPPAGYACVYESWFTNSSLWWPLPEFLTSYCHRRRIALGQYTANGISILVTLTVLAAELGIKMLVRLFEELTTPSITVKTRFFYGKMVPKYNVIIRKPSKVNFWNRAYFYVKINEASFEDPSIILNGYLNANIDRLSKLSQGGTQSFLEEVEAIRTLSHQHWPEISEARIQEALNRINRAHDHNSPGDGRPAKRRRPSAVDRTPTVSPNLPPQTERLEGRISDDDQAPEVLEIPSFEPAADIEVPAMDEMSGGEHLLDLPIGDEPQEEQIQDPEHVARADEVVEYPYLIDFKYQHTDVPFVEDHEAPARLFRQIRLKKKGMPELEQLLQNSRYRKMTRAGAIFFGNANLMVRDYKAKLKAQDEKLALKTDSLKRKRKEIAELAYKCGAYEEQIEELKAQNEGLKTRCRNLEQEKADAETAFESTARRLRESREYEVRKERLRVESALRQQVAPVYEKVRQFVAEQTSIQSKLSLYSQAKGTRKGLEKIKTQGLPMDEVLQQARTDEAQLLEELQQMEVVDDSEINFVLIGLDEHGSNLTAFSPQVIEDLRT
ncbi:hypothetical protein N665_0016s0027 [Sinapis alba]|nr:hypothetical protein N665_0016s0027 [Sinapis alba]